MNRLNLLQSVQRDVIPIRKNGCVCFIPIAIRPQVPDILSDCVRNCMVVSRELGGEPTLEECTMCCTDCIQSFDNPENCREACILGKGGPDVSIPPSEIQAIENALLGANKRYGYFIYLPGGLDAYVFRTVLNVVPIPQPIIDFIRRTYRLFRDELIGGQAIISLAINHRLESIPPDQALTTTTINGRTVSSTFAVLFFTRGLGPGGSEVINISIPTCSEATAVYSVLQSGDQNAIMQPLLIFSPTGQFLTTDPVISWGNQYIFNTDTRDLNVIVQFKGRVGIYCQQGIDFFPQTQNTYRITQITVDP